MLYKIELLTPYMSEESAQSGDKETARLVLVVLALFTIAMNKSLSKFLKSFQNIKFEEKPRLEQAFV